MLRGVDVEVPAGASLAILGPNGSGKTTLLRRIMGALTGPGTVRIDGEDIASMPHNARARKLAAVDQRAAYAPELTVADFVLLGRMPHVSPWRSYSAADRDAARSALARTGADGLADRRMSELSGGEQQRVAIARALAQETGLILLDEPTNHLDLRFQHEVMALIASLPTTTITVCHDVNLALAYCETALVMADGQVVAAGEAEETLTPTLVEELYGVRAAAVSALDRTHLVFRT